MIEAPVESVWELLGNPARHPDWWPRVLEVRGASFQEGDDYPQVTRVPIMGKNETTLIVDKREDFRELQLHCSSTGSYWNWALTSAQGGTFVDVEFGIRPLTTWDKLFDRTFARAYFRSWMAESIKALATAAAETDAAAD
jgi:uncharacterized protein YndB with AHSA1/START domain